MTEEIKILHESLKSEMDRFWTRFNIFSAVQIVAIIGLLAKMNDWNQHPSIIKLGVCLILVWSLVGLIATCRGHDLQRSIVETILEKEAKQDEDSQLVTSILAKTKMPIYVNNNTCIVFTGCCVLFWTIMLFIKP